MEREEEGDRKLLQLFGEQRYARKRSKCVKKNFVESYRADMKRFRRRLYESFILSLKQFMSS